MSIKDKLALMDEIERKNTERLQKEGLLRKNGTEEERHEKSA